MNRNFIFRKVILSEVKPVFYQVNGIAVGRKCVLLKQLMWKDDTCCTHNYEYFVSLRRDLPQSAQGKKLRTQGLFFLYGYI